MEKNRKNKNYVSEVSKLKSEIRLLEIDLKSASDKIGDLRVEEQRQEREKRNL